MKLKKNIRNIKLKENIKLKKKFIGKKVQGSFYDEKAQRMYKIIKVSKIKVDFIDSIDYYDKNITIYINDIFLYTNTGKRYIMDSSYEFKITM